MPATIESLVAQAMELPADLREIVAHRLLQSIDEDDESGVEAEYDPAWEAEILRRIADFDSGKVKGVPAEEVLAALDRIVEGR